MMRATLDTHHCSNFRAASPARFDVADGMPKYDAVVHGLGSGRVFSDIRFGDPNGGTREDGCLMRRKLTFVSCFVIIAGGATAGTVAAAPPEYPHGPGVCMSQIASAPEIVGAVRLGDIVRLFAGPGSKGSDMSVAIDSLRGDGEGGCGAPPGPGHL